jgi:glucose-6-phosphate isomerase
MDKMTSKDSLVLMEELDNGSIANPDENRMVGHYWLRDENKSPNQDLKKEIINCKNEIKDFVNKVHSGEIANSNGETFLNFIIVGIGGSALGPQLLEASLNPPCAKLKAFFLDNTDPDGIELTLESIPNIDRTLVLVVSKSGGTQETLNGQILTKAYFKKKEIDISSCFIAVTGEGSKLDKTAVSENWLKRFPMWDWVGGRTSLWSAVGLLPSALQGISIDELLAGAKDMDALNRNKNLKENPAVLLAFSVYMTTKGKGEKAMVVLPYKDRLSLFSKYLQQLIMESLGKEKNLDGKVVNQGISVYGNKGSTDQHSYVQQLRSGLNNFFAVFIEVLKDNTDFHKPSDNLNLSDVEVAENVNAGDYLNGFYQGTRKALFDNNRESISITIEELNAYSLGQLLALFEKFVGIYACLINVNAYHQPGVEAGKVAAEAVIEKQNKIIKILSDASSPLTVDEIVKLDSELDSETTFKILRHLALNDRVKLNSKEDVFMDEYSVS